MNVGLTLLKQHDPQDDQMVFFSGDGLTVEGLSARNPDCHDNPATMIITARIARPFGG